MLLAYTITKNLLHNTEFVFHELYNKGKIKGKKNIKKMYSLMFSIVFE